MLAPANFLGRGAVACDLRPIKMKIQVPSTQLVWTSDSLLTILTSFYMDDLSRFKGYRSCNDLGYHEAGLLCLIETNVQHLSSIIDAFYFYFCFYVIFLLRW